MFFIMKKRHRMEIQEQRDRMEKKIAVLKVEKAETKRALLNSESNRAESYRENTALRIKLKEAESKIIKGIPERDFIILQARYERGKYMYDVSNGPFPADVIEISITDKDPAKTAKRIYAKKHNLTDIIGLKAERWDLMKEDKL